MSRYTLHPSPTSSSNDPSPSSSLTHPTAVGAGGGSGGVGGGVAVVGRMGGGGAGSGGGSTSAISVSAQSMRRTGPPVAFSIHRILRLLEASKTCLRLSQIEHQLIKEFQSIQGFNSFQFDMRGDAELMRALETNERIHFDKMRNELSYINPFEYITSEHILLQRIRYSGIGGGGGGGLGGPGGSPAGSAVSVGRNSDSANSILGGGQSTSTGGGGGVAGGGMGGGLYGLKVSKDMLNGNSQIKTFVRNILAEGKVRCIRPPYIKEAKVKCLYSAAGTAAGGEGLSVGGVCSVYAKKKCSECYEALRGLHLYTLGDVEAEESRKKVDEDIKQVWSSIELPSMDAILTEQNVVQQKRLKWINPTAEEKRTLVMLKRKKRRMEQKQMNNGGGGVGGKLRKIQNTHLFTADQMRMEMMHQQQ
eukprot:GHVQ01034000.1.p1 GENE.GHVQ01034000.1~~GHVQ01034000.1.p1  ORF type:complete len:419 (+),score=116.20 GHVQ01034000.1:719-1975(+)